MRGGTAQRSKVLKCTPGPRDRATFRSHSTPVLYVLQGHGSVLPSGPTVLQYSKYSRAVGPCHLQVPQFCLRVRRAREDERVVRREVDAHDLGLVHLRALRAAFYVVRCIVRCMFVLYAAHCIVRCTLHCTLHVCIVRCTLRASRWLQLERLCADRHSASDAWSCVRA